MFDLFGKDGCVKVAGSFRGLLCWWCLLWGGLSVRRQSSMMVNDTM